MGKQSKKTIKGRIFRAGIKLALMLILVSSFQVLAFKVFNPPGTVNMVYEWVRGRYLDAPYVPPTYVWKDLDQISPHLRQAVLASEDQRFLTHHGFDFKEIETVIEDALSQKGIRGASTISMQAARSVFLPASRAVVRKVGEAWYTVLIELIWDKKRIFEVYLNTVDWGTGIVGAQAAARAYFSCDADELTPAQAALMTAVLPSPHKWSARRPGPHVQWRRDRILRQMKAMPVL